MESIEDFKQHFNKYFWRAFKGKKNIIQVPQYSKRDQLIEGLYQELIDRTYFPSPPRIVLTTEKENGVPRFSPVFTMKDYCVYFYCIRRLEKKIAFNRVPRTYGGWTLGGLMRKSELDEMSQPKRIKGMERDGNYVSSYSYNEYAWSKAYGEMNSILFSYSQDVEYSHVLIMDIANFYDNIRLDLLELRIREIADKTDSETVSLLFIFLNYWNRVRNNYNKQVVGLPQDAMGDFSRILANFYLQEYDSYMYSLCNELGCVYVRYADDQFIFLKNKDISEFIEFKAAQNLNLIGLSINQLKVDVIKTEDLIKNRSFKTFDIISTDKAKKDAKKVEMFAKEYISLLDNDGLVELKNKGTPLLNRLLFCPAFREIDFGMRVKIMGCYLDDSYLRKAESGKFLRIYNLLSNEDKPKFISKLIDLSRKNNFNSFSYQVLDFFNIIEKDPKLIEERIKELEKT